MKFLVDGDALCVIIRSVSKVFVNYGCLPNTLYILFILLVRASQMIIGCSVVILGMR